MKREEPGVGEAIYTVGPNHIWEIPGKTTKTGEGVKLQRYVRPGESVIALVVKVDEAPHRDPWNSNIRVIWILHGGHLGYVYYHQRWYRVDDGVRVTA